MNEEPTLPETSTDSTAGNAPSEWTATDVVDHASSDPADQSPGTDSASDVDPASGQERHELPQPVEGDVNAVGDLAGGYDADASAAGDTTEGQADTNAVETNGEGDVPGTTGGDGGSSSAGGERVDGAAGEPREIHTAREPHDANEVGAAGEVGKNDVVGNDTPADDAPESPGDVDEQETGDLGGEDEEEDDDEDIIVVDEEERLAERARAKARMRLGSPVSTTSLVEMAKQARDEAKKASRSLDQSTLPDGRFADRELSWLAFNERVLEQAEEQSLQILERAWFLAIFASNLDEFYMVRVAGLKRRIATGMAVTAASGMTPRQVLDGITERTHELMARHAKVFAEDVQPKLAREGIDILHWHDLREGERDRLRKFFKKQIFPVLTPLAVDPAHPFPYISGLSLNLAVVVRNPRTGKNLFARVKVPPLLPRFIAVDSEGRAYRPEDVPIDAEGRTKYVPLEEVIGAHLEQLFPGMEVVEYYTFRVTRNEDMEVEEDDAENLLTALERELMRRRFGPAVRLEVEEGISDYVLQLLVRELGIRQEDVYRLPAPLDLTGLNVIHDLDRPNLKYPKYVPVTPFGLAEVESAKPTDFFEAIRSHDILLHHPYDAFSTSVQQFIAQAASDPKVLAIKQTLYRTSGDSPIIDSLIQAAQAGKQVLALVEIKARFDEQANIEWARKLEHAGVHVVYGIVGLKTHCKLCLVVRLEEDGLRRYCHIGTGNYNPKTARGYEDLGLLTCDRDVGQDLTRLFNQLSGYAPRNKYHRLLVAPTGIRSGLIKRIEREIANKKKGKDAWIKLKTNSLVDEKTIDALYRASQAGVPVDIQVRGICALRAGIPGLSDNIRVRSILGRFLEHSRIYAFCNDGDSDVFIGSADLMHRNLDRRIEALVKITDPAMIDTLVELVDVACADTTRSWHLEPDGWVRHTKSPKGRRLQDIQDLLMRQARSHVAAGK
ncbi:RNA degradosome polyphosphate kinase [Actinobaculum sp. 313]|uniref:RNA degradosome polyphosphate kinase n=1 Tax=Actinobaculum sp. 313 TaxID=2495645 RepID=UPI000D52637B|nr:RNA degradosome polyphosphate kinase [Actinobaculum sp. 313]AWE43509.1 RNA degradosome polyphosphate kinase [Actinobaculum sp. 313]